jgi:hypothetical protein
LQSLKSWEVSIKVILTCKLGEILGGEILPAVNGEMIRHSFTLKHGEWDFFPCLMVKITPFRLHSEKGVCKTIKWQIAKALL